MSRLERAEARLRRPVPTWAAELGAIIFLAACLAFGAGLGRY